MKFIGNLPDPFRNNTNHWILITAIGDMPGAGNSLAGENTTGLLKDSNGITIAAFATCIWNSYATSTNTIGFSDNFLQRPLLIPPGYYFEDFINCQAFELDFQEVGGFV